MLEKMGDFFDSRLDIYDAHQLNGIDSARAFLRFTAQCLPTHADSTVLDLGCGTGLELEDYFIINPSARVTGVDLAPGMLSRLREKLGNRNITLVLGSYFDVPFGCTVYDAAVSVESLHHFTADEKKPLYKKLYQALKPNGFFILTDYFSLSDEEESQHRSELVRLKAEQGVSDNALYHYDTPLTVAHEIQCLTCAGFSGIEILRHWGATYTLKAVRQHPAYRADT